MPLLFLVVGLAVLLLGAELLVRGASRLASSFGVSPLVVGLTVVAFGTSAPELVVSIGAASSGQPGIALGNVIGSNIANILLILGLSAAISPIAVAAGVIRWDVPLMIAVTAVVGVLALDRQISRPEGLLLVAAVFLYTTWTIRAGGDSSARDSTTTSAHRRWRAAALAISGFAALWIGGRWFVFGAVALARAWGLPELVIGLTIVAVGTSLPELATSVLAGIRGQSDIAVGNIVGSNVFNLLAVLGAAAVLSHDGVAVAPTALRFDIPVMLAAALVCLPIAFTGAVVDRWEGLLLLSFYVSYVAFVVMQSREAALATELGQLVLVVVLPLTLGTLAVTTIAEWRRRHASSSQR